MPTPVRRASPCVGAAAADAGAALSTSSPIRARDVTQAVPARSRRLVGGYDRRVRMPLRRVARIPAVNRAARPVVRRVLRNRRFDEVAGSAFLHALCRFPIIEDRFDLRLGDLGAVSMPARDAPYLYWGGLPLAEPEAVPTWVALARGAQRIVDVGANHGLYSLLAARANPSARILAIEPNPHEATRLRETVERNRVAVEVLELALSDARGEAELSLSGGLSSIVPANWNGAPRVRVQTARLDDVVEEAVDLLKIDAEGAEAAVLAGGTRTLAARPPIVCEVTSAQTIAVARELGYRVLRLPDLLELRTGADTPLPRNCLLTP